MRKYLFLSIAGCVLLPSLASAETADAFAETDKRVVHVSYADLDLSDALGRQTLDHRLVNAARAVCDQDSSDPFVQLAAYRCKRVALADARLHMDQAMAYERRTQARAVLIAGR